MDNDAAKIKYGLENPPRAGQRAQQLKEETKMQFKHCTLDVEGSVAVLKFDHQEVMNAVSMDMLGGLAEALDEVNDRRAEVRCLVLTGAGRAFCTGANLQVATSRRSRAAATPERRWKPASIRSCGGCRTCIVRWSRRSTDRRRAQE